MGLAASQARFLALTSRKGDCEFRSMQIAQNKLSVTRELAEASRDYQRSLNATKLVWSWDSCEDETEIRNCRSTTNLSYKTLTDPSELNNFTPYLVTTRTGALVLNNALARAASAISTDGKPVKRSRKGFEDFLNALQNNGIISQQTNSAIQNTPYKIYTGADGKSYVYVTEPSNEDKKTYGLNGSPLEGYDKNAGFGSTPLAKNAFLAADKYAMAGRLSRDIGAIFWTRTTNDQGGKEYVPGSEIFDSAKFSNATTGEECYKVAVNGNLITHEQTKDITLGNLLTDDVTVIYTAKDGVKDYDETTMFGLADGSTTAQILKNIKDNFQKGLSSVLDNASALDKALDTVFKSLGSTVSEETLKGSDQTGNCCRQAISEANDYIGIVGKSANNKKCNSSFALNLSNVLAAVLTLYDNKVNGYMNTQYMATTNLTTSNLVTDDENYLYDIKADNSVENNTLLYTDFYMQLYNNICVNGWTTAEENINQDGYFEQLIKNGTYFISSLGQDGYFYQSRYNDVDCVYEIRDDDAIAKAEAEFNATKAKLTYKEDRLDMEMKNLETEISSLTTELDSVKNLVSKSVEKTFSMFQ